MMLMLITLSTEDIYLESSYYNSSCLLKEITNDDT